MNFIVYHHKNVSTAEYIITYSNLSNMRRQGVNVETLSLPQQNGHEAFAELPAALRRLLFFAKPDVVVCLDDGIRPVMPIFAFEISAHVAARDHWMQRFPNLVGCAQEGIPGAYIMAGATPKRPGFTGTTDPLFFFAYDKVMEIHKTPFFIAEWQSTDGHTLDRDNNFQDQPKHDSTDMIKTFQFFNLVIDSAVHGREFSALMRDRIIVDLRDGLRKIGYQQLPTITDFNRLKFNMPNGRFLTWPEVEQWIEQKGIALPPLLPDRITKRNRSLIFVPQSERKNKSIDDLRKTLLDRIDKRSGDPYTGQPLAFDYVFCRLGQTPYERDTNFIIDLTVLEFSDLAKFHHKIWEVSPLKYQSYNEIKHIPSYTVQLTEPLLQLMKSFMRLYAFTADILVFKDGVIYF